MIAAMLASLLPANGYVQAEGNALNVGIDYEYVSDDGEFYVGDSKVYYSDDLSISLVSTRYDQYSIEVLEETEDNFQTFAVGDRIALTQSMYLKMMKEADVSDSIFLDIEKDNDSPNMTLTLNKHIMSGDKETWGIDISVEDTKSGLSKLYYTKDEDLNTSESNWEKKATAVTFSDNKASYSLNETQTAATYYFYAVDQVGNITEKNIVIDKVDYTKPNITGISMFNYSNKENDVHYYKEKKKEF